MNSPTCEMPPRPDPSEYLAEKAANAASRAAEDVQWVSARCPLHDDNAPSLSVNLHHGGYKCHGRGASGGDVLDFHRRRYDMSFKAAAQDLGAWND